MGLELQQTNIADSLGISLDEPGVIRRMTALGMLAESHWSGSTFTANHAFLKIIGNVATHFDQTGQTLDFRYILRNLSHPFLSVPLPESRRAFQNYRNSPPIEETLQSELALLPGNICSLNRARGPVINLTSTHLGLADEVDIALSQNPGMRPSELGVMVWDSHLDADSKQPAGQRLFKSNVLNGLMERGVQIGIIGLSKLITRDFILKPQLPILYPKSLLTRNGSYDVTHDRSFDIADVSQMIAQMSANGVTNLLHSVDMDAMASWEHKLTGFEYNHFNVLTTMGINDIRRLLAEAGFKYKLDLGQAEQAMRKTPFSQIQDWIDAISAALSVLDSRNPQSTFANGTTISPQDRYALRPEQILKGIQASTDTALGLGITPFMPINNGNAALLGGITELAGKDLEGNTARTALQIASTILKTSGI